MRKEKVLKLYKKVGETPLECLNRFRKVHPAYKNDKMTYAGRLDPLAEGELLVLVGEECKKKEEYLKFDKEYEVDVLFGFETDSYDLLGIVSLPKNKNLLKRTRNFSAEKFAHSQAVAFRESFPKILIFQKLLQSFTGKLKQPYPPYSSQLWMKARKGTLDNMEIPIKQVEIYKIKLLKTKTISKKTLAKYIEKVVKLVKGDFRQKQILAKWRKILSKSKEVKFPVISLKVRCSSGTYMRSLAYNIGKEVGMPSLALRIKRTRFWR